MKTFPMFLQMQDRRVIIIGGGEQAAQKCRLILKTDATITVISPVLDPELRDLESEGRIEWQRGAIAPSSFKDAALVFVATGCPANDACLHMMAKEVGALVNVVDQPHLCDALTPSIVDRSPVVVAIGTEGTAPVLARQIKTRIEELLEPRLGDLAAVAGRLRDSAAARLNPRERRDLWRWVFAGPVRDAHATGAERNAAKMIKQAISAKSFDMNSIRSATLLDAGAGEKDLVTLRGVQRLQDADVIFYNERSNEEILELARRDAQRVFVGRQAGCDAWSDENSSRLLIAATRQGKRVVFLLGGDRETRAQGIRMADALRKAKVSFEIVPGVAGGGPPVSTGDGFQQFGETSDVTVKLTA